MALEEYIRKRNFDLTPEPVGKRGQGKDLARFVIQRHQATRLHYDLRLEHQGVLISWAVPKGPSMNPSDKRLAIQTEDHPIQYLQFEGTIPKGNYGAGEMGIWDSGTFSPIDEAVTVQHMLEEGNLKIRFNGSRIQGDFALVKTNSGDKQDQWLLIKKADAFSVSLPYDAEDYTAQHTPPPSSKFKLTPSKMVLPMLTTQVEKAFSKKGWIYEIKWDGYRLLANLDKGKVNLYSRNGISYNLKFNLLTKNLAAIAHDVILDGEVVLLNKRGVPQFQKLQNYTEETDGELRYYVFDLLFLNGHDLKDLPLLDRKSLIPEVIADIPMVYYCDHVTTKGKAFYTAATKKGLEGIIAKKADSVYYPGERTRNWLKVKSGHSQEVLLCGYTASENRPFGSLILGVLEGNKLTYVGNCGTGFSGRQQEALKEEFRAYIQKKSPFEDPPSLNGRQPIWMSPVLVGEVKFSDWTLNGIMRHPVFKALRKEKLTSQVKVEKFSDPSIITAEEEDTLQINGVNLSLSNLDKLYWPKEGIRKYDLLDYYLDISDAILPFLVDRAQNLHRHPNGIEQEGFYQKDTPETFPEWLKTIPIYSASSEKEINYLLCQDEASLIFLANLGCIELNPWNSRTDSLDCPDYGVIDLDPSPVNTFGEVVEVAQAFYTLLRQANIPSYCKTSGSSGLHIYIPLAGKYSYDQARDFIKIICQLIHQDIPGLTSLDRIRKNRQNKIYLDYLQNRRGQTLASAYCVRPKPGATVSAPLEWKEVNSHLKLEDFTVFSMVSRLKSKPKLFMDVLGDGIDMEKALDKLSIL